MLTKLCQLTLKLILTFSPFVNAQLYCDKPCSLSSLSIIIASLPVELTPFRYSRDADGDFDVAKTDGRSSLEAKKLILASPTFQPFLYVYSTLRARARTSATACVLLSVVCQIPSETCSRSKAVQLASKVGCDGERCRHRIHRRSDAGRSWATVVMEDDGKWRWKNGKVRKRS